MHMHSHNVWNDHICQQGDVTVPVCLSVCLYVSLLTSLRKFSTDFNDIFSVDTKQDTDEQTEFWKCYRTPNISITNINKAITNLSFMTKKLGSAGCISMVWIILADSVGLT